MFKIRYINYYPYFFGTVIDHIPECVLDFRISDKMSEEIRDVFR